MAKFNGVTLTKESIQAARQWFADNQHACINQVLDGSIVLPSHVSFSEYKAVCLQKASAAMAGENDHTFTFIQRAYYIQTSECVALLS